MSSSSSNSFPWTPSHSDAPVRARACGECRRRKVKCDAGMPVCGRCAAAGHEEDCEYVLDDGMTRAEAMEHDIEVLEARVRELESRPKVHRPSPYLYTPLGSPRRNSPIASHALTPSRSRTPDIITHDITRTFLLHASQLGIFLRRDRLSEALGTLPSNPWLPFPHHATYSSFLFTSICLLGIHLSNTNGLSQPESTVLSLVLKASVMPKRQEYVLSDIQAEVFLAYYFLIQGRLLEGMDHINAAISLSIGSGLYHRSPNGVLSYTSMTPLLDSDDHHERANALSVLMVLHKTWGVALQWPSTIPETPVLHGAFSPGALNSANEEIATQARLSRAAKAAFLYFRVASLPSDPHVFQELDHSLYEFLRSIQPLDYSAITSRDLKRNHLVTYLMAQAAVIRLYGNMSDMMAAQKCLVAASSVATELGRIPDLYDWYFVDPVIGTFLMPVCQILARGIANMTKNQRQEGHDSLTHALQQVTSSMSILGQRCNFIRW